MFKAGSTLLQGSLKPTRAILTPKGLVSSYALRSTSMTSSLLRFNLIRYQSQLVDNKIETKPIEAKPIEAKPIEAKQVETKSVEANPSQPDAAEPKSINDIDNRITKNGNYKPPVNMSFKGTFKGDYQRIIKYTLLPLSAIPFYTSYAGIALHPMIDTTIAVAFLWYAHYGFSSLIIDKIPKDKYSKSHRASMWTLYTSTFLGMCGIYELETENNGVVNLITRIWNDDESNIYVFGK